MHVRRTMVTLPTEEDEIATPNLPHERNVTLEGST